MQGMSPLEVKFHLHDIERSFAACRTSPQAGSDCPSPRAGLLARLALWISPGLVVRFRGLRRAG